MENHILGIIILYSIMLLSVCSTNIKVITLKFNCIENNQSSMSLIAIL